MAFSAVPTAWLPNYSNDSGAHTLTLKTAEAGGSKTLAETTDAEADDSTGDIRKIMYGIAEAMYQSWLATDSADRPTKMTMTRSSFLNDTTSTLTRNYTFRFTLDYSGVDVTAE